MHHFRRDAYADSSTDSGINWPQTFVALGVVGVAAWGLWFFMRDRSDAPASPPTPSLADPHVSLEEPGGILVRAIDPVTGRPLVIPPFPAPATPASPPASPPARAPLFLVGDPILLKSGQRYRARLALTGLEASFATSDLVRAKFLANGFVNVFATKNPSDLPADWPSETKGGSLSGVWWVEGDWARPTANVDREPQISQVWQA